MRRASSAAWKHTDCRSRSRRLRSASGCRRCSGGPRRQSRSSELPAGSSRWVAPPRGRRPSSAQSAGASPRRCCPPGPGSPPISPRRLPIQDDEAVLDWESARRPGLPLWDLLYFLVDALPLVEGARTPAERADRALALLRGASVWSLMLFDWLRKAAAAAAMPPAAIGPVATLCWLHHGLSHVTRGRAATGIEPGASVSIPPVERIAAGWLADPALGPDWSPGRD